MKSTPWYQSVAVKSRIIAFVATHIPLLGLIGIIVLRPDWLSPWGVFIAALGLTLAATALVVTILWRMFAPLRLAADGLNGFMLRGDMFRSGTTGSDEIGRLVGVLVKALAHLDRSRSPLLVNSALAVKNAMGGEEDRGDRWFALLEIDQWESIDSASSVADMLTIHQTAADAIHEVLRQGEYCMSWGRARFLLEMNSSGADALERLEPLCRSINVGGHLFTATAALEAQDRGMRSRAAALQRLEQKLYAMRVEGRHAAVA